MLGMLQNNLSTVATKFLLSFLALHMIPIKEMANSLAWALHLFLSLFCEHFALLKTCFLNQNLMEKRLKTELFLYLWYPYGHVVSWVVLYELFF